MARPRKIGLDYFPVRTEFDAELEEHLSYFGNDAAMFWLRVWQGAYQTENGEMSFPGVFRRKTFAKKLNVTEERLSEMIEAAFELGLLDREAYEERQVLTSRGIRRRIADINGMRETERNRKLTKTSTTSKEFSGGKLSENFRKTPGKRAEKCTKVKVKVPVPLIGTGTRICTEAEMPLPVPEKERTDTKEVCAGTNGHARGLMTKSEFAALVERYGHEQAAAGLKEVRTWITEKKSRNEWNNADAFSAFAELNKPKSFIWRRLQERTAKKQDPAAAAALCKQLGVSAKVMR